MSGFLEQEGFNSLKTKAQRYVRDLVREAVTDITQHTTQEVQRIMSELNRLSDAVDKELADDTAQNELIAELKRQLETAKGAVDAATAGEQAAVEQLNEALSAATSAAERLESNDPAPEEPQV